MTLLIIILRFPQIVTRKIIVLTVSRLRNSRLIDRRGRTSRFKPTRNSKIQEELFKEVK